MGLTSFKLYQDLLKGKAHFSAKRMGFSCEPGDINEFANRVRLIKSFRGLQLDSYSEDTKAGYDAFLLIFLTHSALERFIEIFGLKKTDDLLPLLTKYRPQIIAASFVQGDSKKLLYNFLYSRLNKRLQEKLTQVYAGNENNVAYLSESIRHIFAHGHLTATANGIRPRKMLTMCTDLSNFLVKFMDSEFTNRINVYQKTLESGD